MSETVKTRFAPSPTGALHIGGARTALYNYLFAKQKNGTFILRFEDTDTKRSREEFIEDIQENLAWLALSPDAVYTQSKRGSIYKKYTAALLKSGAAYLSREQGGVSQEVIRFRNTGKEVAFSDTIRGTIRFNTTELGDFVIARSVNEPLYHLAVVIDDHDMGITHVIRGEEGISNTPRQILLQEALGFTRPQYAHIPLILSPDRSKLSKRRSEGARITDYREEGYIPEALLNYLAMLGWNPGGDQEMFSLHELVEKFSLERIHKGGAVFDMQKLRWMNKAYLERMYRKKTGELAEQVMKYLPRKLQEIAQEHRGRFQRLVPIMTERISAFGDVAALARAGEFDFYFSKPQNITPEKLRDQKTAPRAEDVSAYLAKAAALLNDIDDDTFLQQPAAIKDALWEYASGIPQGRGPLLWAMRYALTGKERSPDPFTVAHVLGKRETIERLARARGTLSHPS